ncbi:MAG: hypothetical protein KC680_04055 [Candidatus Peregrinibacteria bacterium]|nr:hypothetical protein [Candidatus Peregrinibacteria bacterium]
MQQAVDSMESNPDNAAQAKKALDDALAPFVHVEATDERWRDTVEELIGRLKVAAKRVIENPSEYSPETVQTMQSLANADTSAFDAYNNLVVSHQVHQEMNEEMIMEPPEMVSRLETAIDAFAESLQAEPLDEWQVKKCADTVHDRSRSVVFKLCDVHSADDPIYEQAVAQLQRIVPLAESIVANDIFSKQFRDTCTHHASNATGRVDHIRKQQEQKREHETFMKKAFS